jgi:hypothetical protein
MQIYLDLKRSKDPGGFEGYGSVFWNIDKHGDVILPGAFRDSLPKFLDEGFMGGVGHDHDRPAGRFVKAYEDDRGLFVEGRFSDVTSGKEARTLLLDRVVQKLSVGLDREGLETSQVTAGQLKAMWQKVGYKPTSDDERRLKERKSIRLIHRASLKEVSPVTIPANDEARILAVKKLGKNYEELPEAFVSFIGKARRIFWGIARLDIKAGRVLSGKNEMKLRAMVEVLTSITDEMNNLLMLVSQAPAEGSEEATEEEGKEGEEGELKKPAGKPDGDETKPEMSQRGAKDKPKGKPDESEEGEESEEDQSFARQRGKTKKSYDIFEEKNPFDQFENDRFRDEALKLMLIGAI